MLRRSLEHPMSPAELPQCVGNQALGRVAITVEEMAELRIAARTVEKEPQPRNVMLGGLEFVGERVHFLSPALVLASMAWRLGFASGISVKPGKLSKLSYLPSQVAFSPSHPDVIEISCPTMA